MPPRIKIRSIYSTALTKLVLDAGYEVSDPSAGIRERFHFGTMPQSYDILILDREDYQGVELRGEADQLTPVITGMQHVLLDTVIMDLRPTDDDDSLVIARLEFPAVSKERLDEIRGRIVPTVKNHHRLKMINAEMLEAAESELAKKPGNRAELEQELVKGAIWLPLEKEGVVRVEHVRSSGKLMRPREGAIQTINGNRLVFRRSFSRGRYDGLDLLIRKGDYGLTEIREGVWYLKHNYFSRERLLIGEYYNINTPVELYPYGARYVDLEVDVVRRAGEQAFMIDREKLELLTGKGCIGKELASKALLMAEQILRSLNREQAMK